MKKALFLMVYFLLLFGCIGEDLINDYIEPNLRILNPIASLSEGSQYQFKARFFDESGTKVDDPVLIWQIHPSTLATIGQDGTLKALTEGQATVSVQTAGLQGGLIETTLSFTVTPAPKTETSTTTTTTDTATTTTDTVSSTTNTSTTTTETTTSTSETATSTSNNATSTTDTSTNTTETTTSTSETATSTSNNATSTTDTSTTTTETTSSTTDNTSGGGSVVLAPQFYEGEIISTSGYTLQGNFRYEHDGTQITLYLDENYRASSSLPGLYVYVGNNPRTINGAVEISAVTVFNGAHEYVLPPHIELTDYKYIIYWCKPFSVPVGEGTIF